MGRMGQSSTCIHLTYLLRAESEMGEVWLFKSYADLVRREEAVFQMEIEKIFLTD